MEVEKYVLETELVEGLNEAYLQVGQGQAGGEGLLEHEPGHEEEVGGGYLSWKRRGKEGGKGFVFTWNPRKQMER